MAKVTSTLDDSLCPEPSFVHLPQSPRSVSSRWAASLWLANMVTMLCGAPATANGQTATPAPAITSYPSFPVEFATTQPVQFALTGQTRPASKEGFLEKQAASLSVGCFGPQHGSVRWASPRIVQSNGFTVESLTGSFNAGTRCWQVVAAARPLECAAADTECLAAWPVVEVVPDYSAAIRVLAVNFQIPPGPAPNRECLLTRATVLQRVCETDSEIFPLIGLPQEVKIEPHGPNGQISIGAGSVGKRCLDAQLTLLQPAIDVPGVPPFQPYEYFCTGGTHYFQYSFPMRVWRAGP